MSAPLQEEVAVRCWRCARESALRRGQTLGRAVGKPGWPSLRCLRAFLKADTRALLTPILKIQAPADLWSLRGCWAGAFFCLCELWTWSDFLRYLLFTDWFLRNLSPSVLPRIYFIFFFFFFLTKSNSMSRCLFFLWHSHWTCSSYGKDVTKWWLLATEDEVKQESCRILGADQVKENKSPWLALVMQSWLCVNKKENCCEVSGLKKTPSGHQFDQSIPALILFGYFPGFIKTRFFFFLGLIFMTTRVCQEGREEGQIWSTISPVCL